MAIGGVPGGIPGGGGSKKSLGDRASEAIDKAKQRADNGKAYDVMDPNNNSSNGGDAARQLAKTAKNLGKKVAKAAWKLIKGIFKALAECGWVGWIIIAIIIIIVLVLAFFAMPGMMRDKLLSFFNIDIAKYFQNGAVSALDEDYQDIIDVANYIESMGYSLIGDGFVTPIIKENSTPIKSFEDVVDGHPDYEYRVGDDYKYHFYSGSSTTPESITYYNKYGQEIDNQEGDYLTLAELDAIFEELTYIPDLNVLVDESGVAPDLYYRDDYGNIVNNNTGEVVSNSIYMDEFGIIRKMPSGETEEGQNTVGELALFKDYEGFNNDSDKIKEHARNYDLIRSYLLSDYRIYILKNDDEGILKELGNIFRTAFGGNKDAWSKGLIKLYNAKGGWSTSTFAMHFGGGSLYNLFDGVSMTKDELSISKGLGNNKMQFKITGWAPRYGMSLDFLLALHLGTNAPDLTYAMLQNFDTEIQVYLDEFSGAVDARYVDPNCEHLPVAPSDGDNMYSLKYLLSVYGWDFAAGTMDDYDTLTGLAEWLVNQEVNGKMAALFLWDGSLTLESPDNCEYISENSDGKRCDDVDPNEKDACSVCLQYVKDVIWAICSVGDKHYSSYQPYIARVVGSWFRDTYFIIPNSKDDAIKTYENSDHPEVNMDNTYGNNAVIIKVDEAYLAETGHYWTKYETKEDGEEYQLYFLNPDGSTSDIKLEDWLEAEHEYPKNSGIMKKYDTKEDAEADGWAFVKKTETTTIGEYKTDHDKGVSESTYIDSRVLWSAYAFAKKTTSGEWIKIKYGDNSSVDTVYDTAYGEGKDRDDETTGMFYKLRKDQTIEQVEDAQRGETNTLIKYLFKYRQFYIYDGSTDRGVQVEHDKLRVMYGYSNYTKYDSDPDPDDGDNRGRYYLNKIVADKYSIIDATTADSSINVNNFYTSWKGLKEEGSSDGLLLNDYYGTSGTGWMGEVKDLLIKYGRGAIRQSYSWYTFNTSIDADNLAEQWLDWQLDMYYMDKYGVDLKAYYNTDKDLLKLKYDPRDPDLIDTVQITKTSLNAFAILENTATLDADYAYRDLKELVVELNYFDKEDIDDKNQKVFTWVLPEVEPDGWPIRPWDKQDVEYGTLIESNETYKALTGNTSESPGQEEEQQQQEEEEPEEQESQGPTSLEDKLKSIYELRKSNVTIAVPSTYEEYRRLYALDETEAITEQDVKSAGSETLYDYLSSNTVEELPEWLFTTLDTSDQEEWIDYFYSGAYGKTFADAPEWLYKYLNEEQKTAWEAIREVPGEEEKEQQQETQTSTAMNFNGYTDGQLVSSPVTGKILEIGMHDRVNVYNGETEQVEYIIIQVMDNGTETAKNKTNYFKERKELDSGNDFGYSSSSGYSMDEALDLFYREYSRVCDGYTIMIDGFDVDLSVKNEEPKGEEIPDSEDAFDDQKTYKIETEDGTYKTNKVYGLANTSERKKAEDKERAKADAPFYLRYGVSSEYPSSSGSGNQVYYKASETEPLKGYYVKEGKYIGKTIATKTAEEGKAVEQNKLTYTYADFVDVPGEYMRIQMSDTDRAIVENVEEFFNIPKVLIKDSSYTGSGYGTPGEYGEVLEVDDDAATFIAGVCCAAVTNVYREDSAEEFEQAIAATAWALRNRYEKCAVERVCSPWNFNTATNLNYWIHQYNSSKEWDKIKPVWYAISPDMHTHVESKSEVNNVTGQTPVSYTEGSHTYWANGPWEEAIPIVKAVYEGAYEPIIKDCDSWKSNGTSSLSAFPGANSWDDIILIPQHGNKYFCYEGVHLSAYQ